MTGINYLGMALGGIALYRSIFNIRFNFIDVLCLGGGALLLFV